MMLIIRRPVDINVELTTNPVSGTIVLLAVDSVTATILAIRFPCDNKATV